MTRTALRRPVVAVPPVVVMRLNKDHEEDTARRERTHRWQRAVMWAAIVAGVAWLVIAVWS